MGQVGRTASVLTSGLRWLNLPTTGNKMLAVTFELDWDTVMRLAISLPMAQPVRGPAAFYCGTCIPSKLTQIKSQHESRMAFIRIWSYQRSRNRLEAGKRAGLPSHPTVSREIGKRRGDTWMCKDRYMIASINFFTPQQVYAILSHTTRDGFVYYDKDTFTFRRHSYLGVQVEKWRWACQHL